VYIEDLSPSEIAINLTAIEFGTCFISGPTRIPPFPTHPPFFGFFVVCNAACFEKVRPEELFHMNWQKPERETLAPNISSLTQRFNQV
jgi:hypothetical protein